MSKRFKIVTITTEGFFKTEIPLTKKLFHAGLELLHLRKPEASEEELRQFLKKLPEEFRSRIVIHNHYSLIKEFRLKGAHLPERTRKSKTKIEFLKKKKVKIISSSFHSSEELKKNRRKYEYVFLSPVFDSRSKAGYKSNFALAELKPLLKKHKNVIALGGISDKNILSVKEAGFYGAAAIGCIWEGKNPAANYKKLLSKIE
ncbi:MAG: thiamine phosphate synthase [Bacteroidia bacterium]